MTHHNKICRVCHLPSGKRNVCRNCKTLYHTQGSPKNGEPFNRKKMFKEIVNTLQVMPTYNQIEVKVTKKGLGEEIRSVKD